MKNTKVITFCAVMSALSVAVLLLGSISEILDMTTVLATALLILIAREEIGYKSFGIYATTLVISAIVLPNKLIAVEYAIISLYPYMKVLFDRQYGLVKWLFRLVYFAAGALVLVLLMKLFTPDTPKAIELAIMVAYVVVFLLFDKLLDKFLLYYRFKLRNKLRLDKFFNQK